MDPIVGNHFVFVAVAHTVPAAGGLVPADNIVGLVAVVPAMHCWLAALVAIAAVADYLIAMSAGLPAAAAVSMPLSCRAHICLFQSSSS